jgi:hypothetical protein
VGRQRDFRAVGGVDVGFAIGGRPVVGDGNAAGVEFVRDGRRWLGGVLDGDERTEQIEDDGRV